MIGRSRLPWSLPCHHPRGRLDPLFGASSETSPGPPAICDDASRSGAGARGIPCSRGGGDASSTSVRRIAARRMLLRGCWTNAAIAPAWFTFFRRWQPAMPTSPGTTSRRTRPLCGRTAASACTTISISRTAGSGWSTGGFLAGCQRRMKTPQKHSYRKEEGESAASGITCTTAAGRTNGSTEHPGVPSKSAPGPHQLSNFTASGSKKL